VVERTPLLLILLAGAACELGLPAGAEPHRDLNFIDMSDQPKLKPQRGDLFGARPTGMTAPPRAALATDDLPYPFAQDQGDAAGASLANPLAATPENVAKGRFIFERVCITCHGPQAAGDGLVTRFFPKPPSLMTQKVRDWPDGRIFHVPTLGQGSMPSHAKVVSAEQRWAVILYLRELQAQLPVAPPTATAPGPSPIAPPPPPGALAPTGGTP
jgi:mono/diheme cytochrome c family protein